VRHKLFTFLDCFKVSPLGLFAGKPIGSSDAARSNGGAKVLNNKKKDLKVL